MKRRVRVMTAFGVHPTLLLFLLAASASAAEPEKYALLVGVTTYRHAEMNRTQLKYPEADATAVAAMLKEAGYEAQVLLGEKATKQAIDEALATVGKKGNAEGVVLVGLFGHGVQYGADAYYAPYDAALREAKDAAGNSLREKSGLPKLEPDPESMVEMQSILSALARSGAGNRVLLADCCREDPSAARGRAFGSQLRVADLPAGTAALFACSEGEQAFEHDDWGHGAFTKVLLDQLGKRTAGEPVTAGGLADRVYPAVLSLVQDKTQGRSRQRINPVVTGYVDLKLDLPKPVAPKNAATFVNSVGMTMILLPAGEFQMGSTPEQIEQVIAFDSSVKKEDLDDEQPRHRVRITRPFYLGAHEVTRGQFATFVAAETYKAESERDGEGCWGWNAAKKTNEFGPEYSWRSTGFPQTDDHPVVNVTWNDAVAYAKWLSAKEGRTYRLPTEAEWEYACRAGSDALYAFGDDPEVLARYGNVADASLKRESPIIYWSSISASDDYAFTSPAGSYRPNGFGLYDMHGNVWEWCSDWYDGDYYSRSRADDPAGLLEGSGRVRRGGGWYYSARDARAAYRLGYVPSYRDVALGFRLAYVRSE